jgi:RNA polymerase-binding transcription factor DksA
MKSRLRPEDAKKRLLSRSTELRTDIARELVKHDHEQYATLAGRVTDSGDQAVADWLVDVNLAEVTRDIHELRDVEAALARIDLGTYGECIDCEAAIPDDRLGAMPAASRCLSCQTAYEGKDQRDHHTTL